MAQQQGQNGNQDLGVVEYLELDPVPLSPDPNSGIYFSPNEMHVETQETGDPAQVQEARDGTYDLPGTTGVYTVGGRGVGQQDRQVEKTEKAIQWTTGTKLQILMTVLILIIATSALGITLFGLLDDDENLDMDGMKILIVNLTDKVNEQGNQKSEIDGMRELILNLTDTVNEQGY